MSDRLSEVDELIAEIDDISTMLDDDRRTSDPNRDVMCSRGCLERPCDHVAHLVAAIIRAEEEDR